MTSSRNDLAASVTAIAVIGAMFVSLSVLWPELHTDIGADLEDLGWLISTYTAGRLGGSLAASKVSLVESRNFVIGALITSVAAYWFLGLARGVLIIVPIVITIGVCSGFTDAAINARVSLSQPGRLSIVHAGFGLGGLLVGGTAAIVSLVDWSWRIGALLIASELTLLLIGGARLLGRFDVERAAPVLRASSRGATSRLLAVGLLIGFEATMAAWAPTVLDGIGVNKTFAQVAIAAYWTLYALSRITAGWIQLDASRVPWAVLILVIAAPVYALGGTVLSTVGLLVIGIAIAPVMPTLMGVVSRAEISMAPASIVVTVATVGASLGPLVAGLVLEQHRESWFVVVLCTPLILGLAAMTYADKLDASLLKDADARS